MDKKNLPFKTGIDLKKSEGFVLIATYLVVSLVTTFTLATFARANAFSQASERARNKIIAFNMAEAAIDLSVARLKNEMNYTGTDGYVPLGTNSASGGFSVTVETPPNNPAVRIIRASGFAPNNNGAARAYQASGVTAYSQIRPSQTFNFGVFADNIITLSGNAFTDSYDSRNGEYGPENKTNNGHIGTNSIEADSVSLNGNAAIKGNVTVGTNGDPDIAIKLNGNATIMGSKIPSQVPFVYSPPVTGMESSGALEISGNDIHYLLPGTYRFSSIKVTGNGKLSVSGTVKIYVDGDLDIAGNGIVNTSQQPPNCMFYMTGSSAVKISGNGHLYAGVYAPLASVENSGNGDIFGAVISKTYIQTGNGAIHFDQALEEIRGSSQFKVAITAWQEQNSLTWNT